MLNIQELGLDLIAKNISKNTRIEFKNDWFRFYVDWCGQRGHYVIPADYYGKLVPNKYTIKRVLHFTNAIDEGKDKAVLGEIDLTKCKVVAINEDSVEFENFTIYLNRNNWTDRNDFEYV
jgi:hypothetical protein